MSTAISLSESSERQMRLPELASRRVWQRRYEVVLRVTDIAVVVVAVSAAHWIRFGTIPAAGYRVFDLSYLLVSVVVITVWTAFLTIYRVWEKKILGDGLNEYRRLAAATLSAFGTIAVALTVVKVELARGYLAIALLVGLFGLLASHQLARGILAAKRRRGHCFTSVLVAGERGSARALANSFTRTPEYGYSVVGMCFVGPPLESQPSGIDTVPVFPFDDSLAAAIAASGADAVAIIATDRLGPHWISELSWQLEKLDVDLFVSPGLVGLAGPRLSMRPVADLPLIQLEKPQYDGAKGFEKRAFDVCFSLVCLIAALPVLIAAALAVKVTTGGPVFYRSKRIGIEGKPFQMIKIRTMVDGADQQRVQLAQANEVEGGILFKIRRDPRVTPVGRCLRRYSIDELPQFINVLRREMSVVGPRPPLPSEVQAYDQRVRRRLLVRPGITGLWQVSGRSDLSWDDSVRLDLAYVENWSMMSDLVIAVKTVKAIFRRTGAY